jgi:hypothetical protein
MPVAELLTRADFGRFLNDLGLTGVGVEVGAYAGEFARQVLSQWNGREWLLVDPWQATPEFLVRHGGVEWDMPAARVAAERLTVADTRARLIRPGNSTEASTIPDQIDVAYIDSSHDTASVLRDLQQWWPRIRPGGLLSGHDYLDDWRWSTDINQGVLFGVRTAVDWFAREQQRIVATTGEEFPTWWFRKPVGSPDGIAVVSASTPDVRWRDQAMQNHQRYCDIHGYQYRHVTLSRTPRGPTWARMQLIREAFQDSEWALWLDPDALFMRADVRLEQFWDGVSPFLWMQDRFSGINAGVFFARRCDIADTVLDAWDRLGDVPQWQNHPWLDNAALLHLRDRGRLPGVAIPHRLANSYPHLPGEWAHKDFIFHCTGLLPDVRMALLEDLAVRASLAFSRIDR